MDASWPELGADDILLTLRLNPGAVSGFVDTHQWSPLRATPGAQIAGGYPQAQWRRVALDSVPQVACWRIEKAQLPAGVRTARQLRSYLGDAVDPAQIGDIVVGESVGIAAAPDLDLRDLLPGAVRTDSWPDSEATVERATAGALRLDAVIAPLFRVSRGEAQVAVEYGFIFQNFAQVKKRTALVAAGDQLVYRTKGRIEIASCDATTRSGRIAVTFRRYPI